MATVIARVEFEIKDWEVVKREGQWRIWYAPDTPQPYYRVWRDAKLIDLKTEGGDNKKAREYNTNYVRDMRRSRKELGLCPMCGGERDRGDKAWCSRCAEAHNRRDRQRRAKIKRGK